METMRPNTTVIETDSQEGLKSEGLVAALLSANLSPVLQKISIPWSKTRPGDIFIPYITAIDPSKFEITVNSIRIID